MKTATERSIAAKRSAPLGNLNGLNGFKNGSRIARLALGQLPKGMRRITTYCRQYRKALETAAVAAHGEVNVSMAHLIDAAATHEQHAQVCRWMLRDRLERMAVADIRECSKQIAAAKDARNRAVEALNLDQQQGNVFDALSAPIDADESPQRAQHGDETESSDKLPANADNAKSGLSEALDAGGSQVGDNE